MSNIWTCIQTHAASKQNFAGQPKSNASRAITLTLEKVFGQCRAFHDSMEPIPVERYEAEFINVVCIIMSYLLVVPLTLR